MLRLPIGREAEPRNTEWLVVNQDCFVCVCLALTLAVVICSVGWYRTAVQVARADVPWPLNQLVGQKKHATIVADVGYSLRMLCDKEVPIDEYVDHSYLKKLLPEHTSPGEACLMHYLAVSQTTSMDDAHAASILAQLTVPFAQNLSIRSAI